MNTQKPFCATAINPVTGIGVSETFGSLKESLEWLVLKWQLLEYDKYEVQRTHFDSNGKPKKTEQIFSDFAIRKARDVICYES